MAPRDKLVCIPLTPSNGASSFLTLLGGTARGNPIVVLPLATPRLPRAALVADVLHCRGFICLYSDLAICYKYSLIERARRRAFAGGVTPSTVFDLDSDGATP
jgi:hypothetical protein